MFELQNISKSFGEACQRHFIVQNCSHHFEIGSSYAIMGPSGIGKSTLLHMLAGFEKPTLGSLLYNGVSLSEMQKNAQEYEHFLLHDIGFVFQLPFLIPELSLLENIGFKGFASDKPFDQIMERARHCAGQVGLRSFELQSIETLSGGQQQRVAIARALFFKPRFLLLDEPTAHIDAQTAQDIMRVLKRIQQEGVGVIMATHDAEAACYCDHILKFEGGILHGVT